MSATRPAVRLASRALRARAAVLVCAFFLGHLGGFIHQATTSHTRCAEHGELVHSGAGEASAGVQAASGGIEAWMAAQARDEGQGELRGLPAESDHKHDHCWVLGAARVRARAPHAAEVETPPRVADARALAGLAVPAAGALYRTAPKTSPPA